MIFRLSRFLRLQCVCVSVCNLKLINEEKRAKNIYNLGHRSQGKKTALFVLVSLRVLSLCAQVARVDKPGNHLIAQQVLYGRWLFAQEGANFQY